ncbi:MAG: CU044_5270 family protein [Acidimicrobiales bacterium]
MDDDRLDDELARRIRASLAHLGNDMPASPPIRSPRRSVGVLRAAAAVVVLALVAVTVVLFVQSDDEVSAVTPGLLRFDPIDEGAAELLERAATAALAAGDDLSDGGVLYVQAETWDLDADFIGEAKNVAMTAIVEESWTDRTGAGRRELRPGRTLEPGEVGGVFVPPDTAGEATVEAPISGLNVEQHGAVPDDADAIVTLETLGIGSDDQTELLQALAGLLRREPFDAAQKAALWRSIGAIDGLEVLGSTTDRFGREAVGVALTGRSTGVETQTIFLFDPATATALATEEVLTGDSRALDIPTPALVGYHVLVDSVVVDSVGTRPQD